MAKQCGCGCGTDVNESRVFISGHNLKVMGQRSDQHRARIGEGQKQAWNTKRKRLPLGAKRTNPNGYIEVKTHPSTGRWRCEHSIVMEEIIGRKLRACEHVHHINGMRSDNRPENLFLCETRAHHNQIERSLRDAARLAMESGFIRFNRETCQYEFTEAVLR